MQLTIKPGAALEDAQQINSIVENIQRDMDELEKTIKSIIPERVRLDWADRLRANWEKYYTNEVPAAIADMKLSAYNLKKAVDDSVTYSTRQ